MLTAEARSKRVEAKHDTNRTIGFEVEYKYLLPTFNNLQKTSLLLNFKSKPSNQQLWSIHKQTDPSALTMNRTPLGEPMDPASISSRDRNPRAWLKQYWLNIYDMGISHGQDKWLLAARIDREHMEMADDLFRTQFRTGWGMYQITLQNRDEQAQYWAQKALQEGDAEYQAYDRDFNRMLEHKSRKMGRYLERKQSLAMASILDEDLVTAEVLTTQIRWFSERLLLETIRDANALRNSPEATDAEARNV